jgi:4-hydroxy-2-oxoheptanedioate aldolase
MRPNKLRNLLKENKPTLSTHIHTVWPSVVEAIGYTGLYDYVEFVAEYAPYDLHDLDHLCRAGELHDLGMMIKVDYANHQYVAQRAIGSGFQSVLFADCHNVEEAKTCIRAVRPDTKDDDGLFGVAARRFAYMGYGGTAEYVQALRDVVVMLMIEKRGATDHLEEILSLPGVDMIQWGPADFTMNIGKAGERRNPEVLAMEKHVFQTALKMGVHPRAEINSPDDAKYYLDMGVRHFSIGTDIFILNQWFKTNGDAMRKALEGA